jgi:hypothetical protein
MTREGLLQLQRRDLGHTGFHLHRFDRLAAEADLDQRVTGEQVLTAQQQAVHGIGSGLGRLPVLCLFLFERIRIGKAV